MSTWFIGSDKYKLEKENKMRDYPHPEITFEIEESEINKK
jgi:hypothetical protein